MADPLTFKIVTPHNPEADYHAWWFPNGWRDWGGPLEKRDNSGRLQGKRKGMFADWFVLRCNNTECPAKAVVPVSFVLDHADTHDPGFRWPT